MPSALTYPGVYVEELPSGVHTITGVATSIAAFVGRAARGPIDEPVKVTSVADFERTFGPLSMDYGMGFAVRDFFLNGGSTAVIVRAFKPKDKAVSDSAKFSANDLPLRAAYPGAWGNDLRARVTVTDPAKLTDIAKSLNVAASDLFNLTLHDGVTDTTETFNNVTAVPSGRSIKGVLASQSQLARVDPAEALKPPSKAHKDAIPAGKKTLWDNEDTSSGPDPAKKVNDSELLANAGDFGDVGTGTGVYALNHADLFNLLVLPPDKPQDTDVPNGLHATAAAYCRLKRALYIVDSPKDWTLKEAQAPDTLAIAGDDAKNAALYFPRVLKANPLHGDLIEAFAPSGIIAGIMARTDTTRGVWKAPAGIDAGLVGAQGLTITLNDEENGFLNPLGVNCLRNFPIIGNIVWGARTLRGADVLADQWKYVPVRRTALFIEESLYRGLKWVVFEPNDEPLWGQIRLNVGAFMQSLFRQGAFQGGSARDAYFVKCDKDTTTQNDIDHGVVNVIVGFAPLKPAEFVVVKIQQMAGQIQT
jgi:phage tail sheath protein FI